MTGFTVFKRNQHSKNSKIKTKKILQEKDFKIYQFKKRKTNTILLLIEQNNKKK